MVGRERGEGDQGRPARRGTLVLETAPAARTTVQSPQRWTHDAEWKKDFNDLSKLSPDKIAERRKEFEVVKAVAKGKREGR